MNVLVLLTKTTKHRISQGKLYKAYRILSGGSLPVMHKHESSAFFSEIKIERLHWNINLL